MTQARIQSKSARGNTTTEWMQFVKSPIGQGVRLEVGQFLPAARPEVVAFFSDAFQLETLTPPWLHFTVLTPAPIEIQAGTLIDYRLRLHGVPLRWQSRIAVWEPPDRFVDEQIRGPYRRWYHEHIFEEVEGGTRCRDVVDYEVPGGWLVDRLLIRADVARIFQFRMRKLRELFPPASHSPDLGRPSLESSAI